MKRRAAAILAGTMLMTAVLSGCSGGQTQEAQTSQAAPDTASTTSAVVSTEGTTAASGEIPASGEKVAIEFFHQKPENVELYNDLIARFMEENPDIQVNITLAETTTTTLISRVAAGNIPNVVSVYPWSASYKDMFKEGLFRELTNEPFMERVVPGVLERSEIDGKQYALPLTTNTYGLYYNKDIFEELKLEVPKTMDELWGVCDKLVEAGIQPFSFPDKKTTRISQMFDRMLIGCVDHDFYTKCDQLVAGEYKITEDPNIRAYAETIVKLREYANPDSLGYDDEPAYEEFTSGKSAMYIDGSWAVVTFETMNPELNFDCTAIPVISEGEFWTAGTPDTAFSISSDSTEEQYQAALKLLNFFVREDIAQEFSDRDKNPTLVKGVNYGVEQLEQINEFVSEGRFGPSLASVWTQDLRNNLNVSVQALILDKDVDTFLEEFQGLVEEYYTSE